MSGVEAQEYIASYVQAAIDDLDFVKGLGSGTLPEDAFRFYLAQDALYLNGYARALAELDESEKQVFIELLTRVVGGYETAIRTESWSRI